MEKGYLHAVVWIVLLTVVMLLAVGLLPEVDLLGTPMRKVDILSDLRADSAAVAVPQAAPEAVVAEEVVGHVRVDTCREGITCIDDMSDETDHGMTPFYRAIDSIHALGRPVRVAVLGDSFIEGDILTANLREMLQKRYGGCGVGYLPLTSNVAGFRMSVRQHFGDWNEHNANDPKGYDASQSTITGHYYHSGGGNWTEMRGVKEYLSRLDTCSRSTFYYMGTGTASVTATVNGTERREFQISADGTAGSVSVEGRIGSVRWTVNRAEAGVIFLGASMDGLDGICVDNFALRSASGIHLAAVSEKAYADFDRVRHYDLVIIMYGLNVASNKSSEYASYQKHMKTAIERMKAAMPTTGILVVSVGDREVKRGGELHTPPGVLSLVNAQQKIAFDNRVAFWNLYKAMGGEGSIVAMVNAKPSLANLDYTHINARGGAHVAKLLYDALTWGQEQYHRMTSEQKGGGQ